jgi:transcriptional regulator with XRE-family HTH domain
VAQRAHVSPTWYTWLEQGRGGAPSADVLDRIARALLLTDAERDHLHFLGLGHSPAGRRKVSPGVTPRLQRVLDAMELSPAMLRTVTWDIIAWNRATSLVMGDYEALEPEQRNALRAMFLNPARRARLPNWEADARFVVAAFRVDITRAGAAEDAAPLIAELMQKSPEFARMWEANEVRDTYSELAKKIVHPEAGIINLEYSTFAVVGRPDLSLVVYCAATPADEAKVREILRPAGQTGVPDVLDTRQ